VKIASHFANRTPQMIKNRFYSHIRKNAGLLINIKQEADKVENLTLEESVSLEFSETDKNDFKVINFDSA